MTTRPSPPLARVADLPDIAALTGIRSGKVSYYDAYQRSNERLGRAIVAMDSLSRAVVHPGQGARALVGDIARVAKQHMDAPWVLIALRDRVMADVRPRLLAIGPDGAELLEPTSLPAEVREQAEAIRGSGAGVVPGWVRVPMRVDDEVIGGIALTPGLPEQPEDADASVLTVLANLAAVCVHTSELYRAGIAEQRRAQQLFDEVAEQTRHLASRTEELRAAEQRLRVADQRALVENERRRIALELHDSVAQTVLTAGLAVEVLRDDAAALVGGAKIEAGLERAHALMATATEQLRSVIYALHHQRSAEDVASLPELLEEMAAQHRPHLSVLVRIEGRPVPLGTTTEHALARIAGEALFNVTMHAHASRAVVRLRYLGDAVALRISDDGQGDPVVLRGRLRLERRTAADGRHRGLSSMALRAEGLGGRFTIRRSRIGGIAVEARVPLRPAEPEIRREKEA